MQQRGGAAVASLLVLCSLPAGADEDVDTLLRCSAEFYARAEYNRTLGYIDAGHITYLMNHSERLLSLAEGIAPLEVSGCPGDGYGLALGLAICSYPADLDFERRSMALDRLAELADETNGNQRLSVCIEDEVCSACLNISSHE
ncbi:hypothetical protein [Neotabrizicola sp. sgz301269]|uniref:hypothetical protein n=1 Tax=Neotabrizicola sp. sgz301269 TaxID=3276282 RepID=UPI00376FF84C